MGDALADDIGSALGGQTVGFLPGHVAAGVVPATPVAGILLGFGLLAEAAVGVAALHQQFCVFPVKGSALGLHIGGHGAAHVGTLVVLQVALGHGLVDDVHRALHQTALVGVLDAQDELALAVPGDQVGVERRAQVADVHISRGGGGKTGAHLAGGDPRLHLFKPTQLFHSNLRSFSVLAEMISYPAILFCIFAVVKPQFFC